MNPDLLSQDVLRLTPEIPMFAGATEQQIRDAEAKMELTFPPEVRELLKCTNGCRSVHLPRSTC